MRLIERDLEDLFGQGEAFESLLYNLVSIESRYHGIPRSAITRDPRTTLRDGGRDIIISRGHDDVVDFIPSAPSVWSAKSGINDLSAAKLRREIAHPGHAQLRAHLAHGGVYVLCTPHPMSADRESQLRTAFTSIPGPDGVTPYREEQFICYSASAITNALNRHVGIIRTHFPRVARLFEGCVAVSEWDPKDLAGPRVPFVAVGGRASLIERIRLHLTSNNGPSLLHIGGLSGVGKSRVVFEAVHGRSEFASALYVERFTTDVYRLISQLQEREPSCLMIIVDETPLEELSSLRTRCGSDPRLRVVSIGPTRRDERLAHENVVVVPEPDTTAEVLPVVEQAGSGLDRKVLRSIAEQSAHDLRLGLLLVRATQGSVDCIDLPLEDGAGLWNRVCSLFRRDIAGIKDFECNYRFLTVAIDIGFSDRDQNEIESIAKFFGVPFESLLNVRSQATRIGLGYSSPHFFEAVPRALAIHIFEREVFDLIHPRIQDLLRAVPDRLRRQIVKRCQELNGECREKADRAISDFFYAELGGRDITQLTTVSTAAFIAWAELDPAPALRWLRESLESATDANIAELDSRALLSRGPSPRRQIVWLCECLASFGRHFASCESILWRLASLETERGIANNSTGVWKGLFLPVLAFTEVPFASRAELLLDRLRDASLNTAPVVVDAVMDALATYFGGRCAPPSVVGGYLTPPEWMPKTAAELRALQVELATRYLEVAQILPADIRALAIKEAVNRLEAFHRLGVLGQLKSLLERCGDEFLREARQKASAIIVFHDRKEAKEDGDGPGSLQELLAFEMGLSPKTLLERIEDVTTRHPWDVAKRNEWDAAEKAVDPYAALAVSLSAEPLVLAQCESLFSSERVRSDAALGLACGGRDDAEIYAATVDAWLQAGVCSGFLSGYLQGVAYRSVGLPPRWSRQLDQLACTHPRMVAELTLAVEHTATGLSRLLSLVSEGMVQPSSMLRLAFKAWTEALDEARRMKVVTVLSQVPDEVRVEGLATALKLGQVWGNFGKASFGRVLTAAFETTLAETIGGTRETHAWVDVLTSIGMTAPLMALDLAANALVQCRTGDAIPSELLLPVLKDLAAAHPAESMKTVGALLLDPRHRLMFGVLKFDGLFDAIGVDAIRDWARDKDAESVAMIARHLDGPRIESGTPFVPPLADWLFHEYGMDSGIFDEFCAGRHAFEIRVGTARDRWTALNALLEPFRRDQREWVRRWVEYEERMNNEESRWDAVHEEDIDRR